jgi:hypothetical protein
MSDRVEVTMTAEERDTLKEALAREFGQSRITLGGYARLIAQDRIDALEEAEAERVQNKTLEQLLVEAK